jgi:hypothetical protein
MRAIRHRYMRAIPQASHEEGIQMRRIESVGDDDIGFQAK